MVKKPVIDPKRSYLGGWVTQHCSACAWEEESLKNELAHCPKCGAPVDENCSIKFGGTKIVFNKSEDRFTVYDSTGGEAIIYGADFADAVCFMLRRPVFWKDAD